MHTRGARQRRVFSREGPASLCSQDEMDSARNQAPSDAIALGRREVRPRRRVGAGSMSCDRRPVRRGRLVGPRRGFG